MERVCRGCGTTLRHEEMCTTPRIIAPTCYCPNCGTQLARTAGCRSTTE